MAVPISRQTLTKALLITLSVTESIFSVPIVVTDVLLLRSAGALPQRDREHSRRKNLHLLARMNQGGGNHLLDNGGTGYPIAGGKVVPLQDRAVHHTVLLEEDRADPGRLAVPVAVGRKHRQRGRCG